MRRNALSNAVLNGGVKKRRVSITDTLLNLLLSLIHISVMVLLLLAQIACIVFLAVTTYTFVTHSFISLGDIVVGLVLLLSFYVISKEVDRR